MKKRSVLVDAQTTQLVPTSVELKLLLASIFVLAQLGADKSGLEIVSRRIFHDSKSLQIFLLKLVHRN